MTQDERWIAKYNEVVVFIQTNHRNPSRHRIEEHDMLNWLKATRKRMNAGELKEHATLESIRQSEKKKIDVLGRYYGKQFYKGNTNWQDMHQVITMVGNLTFRQIVMIRLINEGFKGLDGKMFISNEAVCVEVNRLLDYGIWQTEGAILGTNDSRMIQLDSLIPTFYTEKVCDALMLEKLSDDDIKIVIETLHLTAKGSPQKILTEDDYKVRTTWNVEGEKLILPDGNTYGGDPDEEMFLYDKARGK